MSKKKYKILCLEPKKYYEDLGIFNNILEESNNNFIFQFNGNKKYKISDEEILYFDLIISIHYTNYLSNFLIIKAKKNGVKTLLLADGIMDWSNFFNNPKQLKKNLNLYHPIIHDHFWTVGKFEKEYFMYRGQKTNFYLPSRILKVGNVFNLPKQNKILVTTANTAYFNEIEKIALINSLKEIKKNIEEKNIEVVYRIFDENLLSELKIEPQNNNIISEFDDILKEVSSVITTPSSITINAMFHNRSVGQIIYRDSPLFVQSGWNLSSGYSISSTIDSLLAREVKRMEFQKYQVSNYLAKDFNVNQELKKIIDFPIDNKKNQIEIQDYIDQNLYGLLNSKTNINIENIVRKIYLKMKGKLKIKFFNF